MKKLTIDSLDSLFNYINKPSTVFWLRDKSYQKQIYISPSFEKLWGIPCASLYEETSDSLLLKSTFIQDEEAQAWNELNKLKETIGSGNIVNSDAFKSDAEVLLRIKNPKEDEKFIVDYSYLLVNDVGEHLGFAGIADQLTKDEWYAKLYAKKSRFSEEEFNPLKKHIFDVLKKEAGLMAAPNTELFKNQRDISNNSRIPLYFFKDKHIQVVFSQRESECIYYLLQGKSAKQTGILLHVSPRTVEFHLANARDKAQCRSKLELLSKVVQIKS